MINNLQLPQIYLKIYDVVLIILLLCTSPMLYLKCTTTISFLQPILHSTLHIFLSNTKISVCVSIKNYSKTNCFMLTSETKCQQFCRFQDFQIATMRNYTKFMDA